MAVMTRRHCLGVGVAFGGGLLAAACDIAPAGAPEGSQEVQDRPAAPKRSSPDLPRQTQRQVAIRVRYTPEKAIAPPGHGPVPAVHGAVHGGTPEPDHRMAILVRNPRYVPGVPGGRYFGPSD